MEIFGFKEFKVTIPQLPEFPVLAQGGIAMKPTMAMVGEGRENEAILPLSKLQSLLEMNEHNSISPAAAMIGEMIGQGGPSRDW